MPCQIFNLIYNQMNMLSKSQKRIKVLMKQNVVYVLLLIMVFSCKSDNKQLSNSDIPVIDLLKNYPKKEIHLQEIADIEYVALETTDDVLLGESFCIIFHVSDEYILISDRRQAEIFVFNRDGKIITHFNRKGQRDSEYTSINLAVFDEKKEEIFVFSSDKKIVVFTLKGEHIRTLEYPIKLNIRESWDFDDETLLVYDELLNGLITSIRANFNSSSVTIDPNPYKLISKKDGSVVSTLDINLTERYQNVTFESVGGNAYAGYQIDAPNNRLFGQDRVLADMSSDTIYLLSQNGDFNPLFIRTPSVHKSKPTIVWTTLLTTDKFIVLHKAVLDFEAAKQRNKVPPQILMYEFETGEIYEVHFVNDEYEGKGLAEVGSTTIARNMAAHFYSMPELIKHYEEKKLKGNLGKLVATLDADDNQVVAIMKFK